MDNLSQIQQRAAAAVASYTQASQGIDNSLPTKTNYRSDTPANPKKSSGKVILMKASDIPPEAINWLWDGWLALGKFTVLAGAGGTGKTTLALALAATVTNSGRFPDGSLLQTKGNVLMWSGEDDANNVLVPRLMAAGADLNRFRFISAVADDGKSRSFDPATDVQALTDAVKEMSGVSLLIIDPLVSAVKGRMNDANVVRQALQPLVDFAEQHQCAIIGITHFSKNTQMNDPSERVLGSGAFTQLARVVWGTATNKANGERVVVRCKSNIGPDGDGCRYTIDQVSVNQTISASRVRWEGVIDGSAKEILSTYEATDSGANGSNPVDDCESWLSSLLDDLGGKLERCEIMAAAKLAGYAERTVGRARSKLCIEVNQSGFGRDKKSVWTLKSGRYPVSISPSMPNRPYMPTHDIGTHETDGTDAITQKAKEYEKASGGF